MTTRERQIAFIEKMSPRQHIYIYSEYGFRSPLGYDDLTDAAILRLVREVIRRWKSYNHYARQSRAHYAAQRAAE